MKPLLLLPLIAAAAWANPCQTAATATPGNWSDSAIWTNCGGGVPGIGDTALIQRPVTMDVTVTVGTSPADTVSAITGPAVEIRQDSAGTFGALTVASGVTWTMRGSVMLAGALSAYRPTLTFNAGSALTFDASAAANPAVTVYRVYLSAVATVGAVVMNGSAGSPVTVRGKPVSCANCANSLLFDARGFNATARFDAAYVDLYDLGCASCKAGGPKSAIGALQWYADATYAVFRIQHATFTRTAGIGSEDYGSTNTGAGIWVLNDVKSFSSLTPWFVMIAPSTALTTGTRSITNCYFDTGMHHTYANLWGFTVDHTVFDGQQQVDGAVHPAAVYTNNVMRYVSVGGGSVNPAGTQDNTYYYVQAALDNGNSQGIGFVSGGASSITVSNLIYEFGPGVNQEGTVASVDTPSTRVDLDHSLILPTAQNKTVPSGDFNVGNGPYRLTHNLLTVGTFVAGSAYYGEQAIGAANTVDTVKSNIFIDLNGTNRSTGLTTAGRYATVVANHFTPAGITHNTNWHYKAVTQWTSGNNPNCNPCTSNGTPYDIATTGVTPGANDVNQDPQFVWQKNGETATGIREWALALHGVPYPGGSLGASADASAAFAVFGTGNVTALIDEMFSYIRGRWAPANTALKGAAHDSGDIGPVPVAATPSAQSIAMAGTDPNWTTGAATIPNRAPYTSLTSMRWEARLHNLTLPSAAYAYVAAFPGDNIALLLYSDGSLRLSDNMDAIGATPSVNIAGRADVVVRGQRNLAAGKLSLEVWNADGTGYVLSSAAITSAGTPAWAGNAFRMGYGIGRSAVLNLAYFRWLSTLVALNSRPPTNAPAGDLGDWELEGNGNDASAGAMNLSFNLAPGYGTTPTYGPVANPGLMRTAKTNTPAPLDASGSYSLQSDGTLTYHWEILSAPPGSTAAIASPASVATSFTPDQYGAFQIRLTVTDSSNRSASATVKIGSVCTDANDVVDLAGCGVYHGAAISAVLGPMLRWGSSQNPWPGIDIIHKKDADYIKDTPAMMPPVPGASELGPLAVFTPGSTAVVCATPGACQFNVVFQCSPTSGDWIVPHYVVDGQSPHTGLRPYRMTACADGDHATLERIFDASVSPQTVVYGRTTDPQLGAWYGSADNVNYYDVCLGHFNLAYRSGIDDYFALARACADNWYTQPWFDEGRAGLDPRRSAVQGLILRALDKDPPDNRMWTNLRAYIDRLAAVWMQPALTEFQDVREQGYIQIWTGLMAAVDPDAAQKARYAQTATGYVTNFWDRFMNPDGSWKVAVQAHRLGTVSVAQGSTAITGSGTGWGGGQNCKFITIGTDPKYYFIHVTSPTTGYLDQNSDRTQNNAAYTLWQYHGGNGPDPCDPHDTPSFSGYGSSPFLHGLAMSGLVKTHMATNDTLTLATLRRAVDWFSTYGYYPSHKGTFYARYYYECNEPSPQTSPWANNCAYGSVSDSRDINSVVLQAFGYVYAQTGVTAYKTLGDTLAGAALGGGYGGPNTDGAWGYFCMVPDLAQCPQYSGSGKWKDYAFAAGAGFAMTYPAYRLGAPDPCANPTLVPTSASPTAAGGPASVAISFTDQACAWTSNNGGAPWITITSGAGGTGNGTTSYTVAANPGGARNATMSIAGVSFPVNQAALPCTYSINPAGASYAAAGGSGSISVTAGAGCPWTATSPAEWVGITAGDSGSGNGTVLYAVAANAGTPRSATLAVAGQSFEVTQAAPPPLITTKATEIRSVTGAVIR